MARHQRQTQVLLLRWYKWSKQVLEILILLFFHIHTSNAQYGLHLLLKCRQFFPQKQMCAVLRSFHTYNRICNQSLPALLLPYFCPKLFPATFPRTFPRMHVHKSEECNLQCLHLKSNSELSFWPAGLLVCVCVCEREREICLLWKVSRRK